MKKYFIFAIITSIALAVSCSKEIVNQEESIISPVSLTVTSENTTKATINSSDAVIWQEGDMIGVRVYKGTAYNGTDTGSTFTASDWTFNLTSGQNTSVGTFSNSGLDQWHHWSYAAFYPVFTNSIKSNGNIEFEFKTSYDNYSSGLFLTPLAANLNTNNSLEERPTTFSFKQIAGTILVTIENVPVAANKFSLALSGKAITGKAQIAPTTVGDGGRISSVDGTAGAPVYFNFNRLTTPGETMMFYVPVPTMTTTPALTVKLYINNDELWSKTSTKTQPEIARGTLLDMAALSVEDDGTSAWSLIGNAFDGWDTDVALTKIKGTDWVYILNRAVNANSAFKFRKDGKWEEQAGFQDSSYGVDSATRTVFNGGNDVGKVNGGAGNYDIFFNTSSKVGYFFKR